LHFDIGAQLRAAATGASSLLTSPSIESVLTSIEDAAPVVVMTKVDGKKAMESAVRSATTVQRTQLHACTRLNMREIGCN
jgi:hypothetical protein